MRLSAWSLEAPRHRLRIQKEIHLTRVIHLLINNYQYVIFVFYFPYFNRYSVEISNLVRSPELKKKFLSPLPYKG